MKYPFKNYETNIRYHKIFVNDTATKITSLSDYELLFHYFKLLKPRKILIAGGFTNCDFFYAIQSCNSSDVEAVNYDILEFGTTEEQVNEKQDWLKEFFEFNGEYTFVNGPINYDDHIDEDWDLIWDHNTGNLAEHIHKFKKNIPVILTHQGHPFVLLNDVPTIDKHIPLSACTRNTVYFGISDTVIKKLVEINDNEIIHQAPGTQRVKYGILPFNREQSYPYIAHGVSWRDVLSKLKQAKKYQ